MPDVKTHRPLFIALASVAACLAIGGLLLWLVPGKAEPEVPAAFELKGTISLDSKGSFSMAPKCGGKDGYDDINPGATVVIYDSGDKVLATGSLDGGKYAKAGGSGPCVFPFTVKDVPGGEKFYQVQVSHRGKVPVEAADAKAGKTSLSLG